jgi:hypothetical protein
VKKTLVPAAALAMSLMTVSVGWAQAQEPADCGAATSALTSAQSDLNKAKDDDEKAQKATDDDTAFDRADRELRQAQNRLDRAQKAVDEGLPAGGTEAEQRELESAKKDVRQATNERDRARKQADKENAAQLQRVADRTDAAELQKRLDAAQEDVNRLCGGVTTTPQAPDNDVDCDEVSDARAQEILDADRSDPNNLDTDNDGVACEEDILLNPPPAVVVVPNGGVATGGGPA